MTTNIYIDGACWHNGRKDAVASWAYYVPGENEASGLVPSNGNRPTNNRGELMGILKALEWCERNDITECRIMTDSKYAQNTSLGIWARNVNLDLLNRIDELTDKIKTEILWVKAHVGNENNEIADSLATAVLRKKLGSKYSLFKPRGNFKGWRKFKSKSK